MDVGPLVLRHVWAHAEPEGLLMHDNKGPDPHVVLPEYANLQQIFNNLSEKVKNAGGLQSGTFLIDEKLAGIMILGEMRLVVHMSRMLSTLAQSPLVRMPEKV